MKTITITMDRRDRHKGDLLEFRLINECHAILKFEPSPETDRLLEEFQRGVQDRQGSVSIVERPA